MATMQWCPARTRSHNRCHADRATESPYWSKLLIVLEVIGVDWRDRKVSGTVCIHQTQENAFLIRVGLEEGRKRLHMLSDVVPSAKCAIVL